MAKVLPSEANFFDDLKTIHENDRERIQTDSEKKAQKLDYMIHQVFEQNEQGKELLTIWKDALVLQPVAEAGMDSIGIGIREGMKRFIRGIILTINRVEKGDR